jgi:hypothetical protein
MQTRPIDFHSLHLHNFYYLSRLRVAEKFGFRLTKFAPEKVLIAARRRDFHAVKFDCYGSFQFHLFLFYLAPFLR